MSRENFNGSLLHRKKENTCFQLLGLFIKLLPLKRQLDFRLWCNFLML
nr:polypyrimidine tract-binding protein homolog 2-like isoform X3 [Ipomoea batatas]